jgi:membrane-bound inhibitor of C-type lysozyme
MRLPASLARFGVLATALVGALEAAEPKRISFAPDKASASVSGTVKGYEAQQHVVQVRAGQTLRIDFKGARRTLYYNVSQAGREGLLRNGSSETANPWSTTASSDGDYLIDVYFMRNEARRDVSSTYTLTATITGGATAEPAAPRTVTVRYNCEDGGTVTVAYVQDEKGGATVTAGGKTYELKHVPSGSGARYSDGTTEWWNKGRNGLYSRGGKTTECAEP